LTLIDELDQGWDNSDHSNRFWLACCRLDRGEYRLKRLARQRNEGLVKLLLACPVKGWFEPMDRRKTTDDINVPKLG
jgi:hypothetical protein